jgi:hypothetical protein
MKLQIASVCSLALVVVACSKNDSGGAATTGAFLWSCPVKTDHPTFS